MAQIRDIVRMTSRGSSIPDVDQELPYSAYCLYEAVKSEMLRSGDCDQVSRGGMAGLEGPISVPTVLRFLWPGLRREDDDDPESETHRTRVMMYRYLRATKNLVCVKPGNRRNMSIWWVRSEWNDVPPPEEEKPAAVKDMTRDDAAAPAGSQVCPRCGRAFITAKHLTRHYYKTHEDLDSLIIKALTEIGKPAPLNELVAHLAGGAAFIGAPELVRVRLISLSTGEGAPVTVITPEDSGDVSRRHYLARKAPEASASPGSERDEPAPSEAQASHDDVRCREPACGRAFPSTRARIAHEDKEHLSSAWRIWDCGICESFFYTKAALSSHLSGSHLLGALSPEFQKLSQDAAGRAAKRQDQLEPGSGISPALGIPQALAVPRASDNGSARPRGLDDTDITAAWSVFTRLADEVRHLREENASLRKQLEAGAAVTPASSQDETAGSASLAAENDRLKAQLGSLQRKLAGLI